MGIHFYFRIIKSCLFFKNREHRDSSFFKKKKNTRHAKLCKLTRAVLYLVWIDVFTQKVLLYCFPAFPNKKNLKSKTSEVLCGSLITTDTCQWTSFSSSLGFTVRGGVRTKLLEELIAEVREKSDKDTFFRVILNVMEENGNMFSKYHVYHVPRSVKCLTQNSEL